MKLVHSNQIAPGPTSARLTALLHQIFEPQLREWVSVLSRPRHFSAEARQNLVTAKILETIFTSFGYEVQWQGPSSNIIALPATLPEEVILLGAHYDSVPGSPGADDNGSALAALLGCAAACILWKPAPPLIFVAFNREEDGHIGSSDFVRNYLPTAPFRIRSAHILEMVGYASTAPGSQRIPTGLPIPLSDTGDFLGLLANEPTAPTMDQVLHQAATYTPTLPVTGLQVPVGAELALPVLDRSDHAPFWSAGMPALLWTDTAEFRNPHYHQPTDTPKTLNYTFLHQVTQLLTATTLAENSHLDRREK